MLIKIIHEPYNHLFRTTDTKPSYQQIIKFVKSKFPRLPERYAFSYCDKDIMKIIDSQESLRELYQVVKGIHVKLQIVRVAVGNKEAGNEGDGKEGKEEKEGEEGKEGKEGKEEKSGQVENVQEDNKQEGSNTQQTNQINTTNTDNTTTKQQNPSQPSQPSQQPQPQPQPTNPSPSPSPLSSSCPPSKISPSPSPTTATAITPQTIHQGISCSQCGAQPIKGIHYKCTQCDNYDICDVCQLTTEHSHIFLKIKKVEHRPIKIRVQLVQNTKKIQQEQNKDRLTLRMQKPILRPQPAPAPAPAPPKQIDETMLYQMAQTLDIVSSQALSYDQALQFSRRCLQKGITSIDMATDLYLKHIESMREDQKAK